MRRWCWHSFFPLNTETASRLAFRSTQASFKIHLKLACFLLLYYLLTFLFVPFASFVPFVAILPLA